MTGLIITLIVVVVGIIGAALFIVRRRARDADVLPPPELGDQVDYTSLPVEEPVTFGERVRAAPLALKLLAGLLLIGLMAVIGIAYFAFVQSDGTATTPVGPPPEITDVAATVANARTISVRGNTNLPDGTSVTVALQEDGQPFEWAEPSGTTATVQDGRIVGSLERRADAPAPQEDRQYTVALNATDSRNREATAQVELNVPAPNRAAFFSGGAVAEAPTSVPEPTTAPTAAPKPTVAPTAVPEPTGLPEATTVPTQTATVFNGGRIRSAPTTAQNNQVGTINAGETLQVLAKNDDGSWYKITDKRGITGWVSASLIRIDAAAAAQVPVDGAEPDTTAPSGTATAPSDLEATVINGGRIRSAPSTAQNNQVGTINAGETVQLLAKTSNGAWYKITDERETTGWVASSLLRIDAKVAAQVPVGK